MKNYRWKEVSLNPRFMPRIFINYYREGYVTTCFRSLSITVWPTPEDTHNTKAIYQKMEDSVNNRLKQIADRAEKATNGSEDIPWLLEQIEKLKIENEGLYKAKSKLEIELKLEAYSNSPIKRELRACRELYESTHNALAAAKNESLNEQMALARQAGVKTMVEYDKLRGALEKIGSTACAFISRAESPGCDPATHEKYKEPMTTKDCAEGFGILMNIADEALRRMI